MRSPESDVCVLCGSRPATTRDHVPPKGLFKGEGDLSDQLITVPACSICNNGSSSEDEDIRFIISAQIGNQCPESAALWKRGGYKSIKRKTKLRDAVQASMREIETTDNQGNKVARLAFNAPVRTYQVVFERTTRGLYFHHTSRILPAVTPITIMMLSPAPNLDNPDIKALARHSVADPACVYRFGIAESQSDQSVWLYEFYQAHYVMAITGDLTDYTSNPFNAPRQSGFYYSG